MNHYLREDVAVILRREIAKRHNRDGVGGANIVACEIASHCGGTVNAWNRAINRIVSQTPQEDAAEYLSEDRVDKLLCALDIVYELHFLQPYDKPIFTRENLVRQLVRVAKAA